MIPCKHLYAVNKQQPISLFCLTCWSVLAYESAKRIRASHALIVLVDAVRLNQLILFLSQWL